MAPSAATAVLSLEGHGQLQRAASLALVTFAALVGTIPAVVYASSVYLDSKVRYSAAGFTEREFTPERDVGDRPFSIAEPFATVTNLCLITSGIGFFFMQALSERYLSPQLFGMAIFFVFLGAASWAFHADASESKTWQHHTDRLAMYCSFTYMSFMALNGTIHAALGRPDRPRDWATMLTTAFGLFGAAIMLTHQGHLLSYDVLLAAGAVVCTLNVGTQFLLALRYERRRVKAAVRALWAVGWPLVVIGVAYALNQRAADNKGLATSRYVWVADCSSVLSREATPHGVPCEQLAQPAFSCEGHYWVNDTRPDWVWLCLAPDQDALGGSGRCATRDESRLLLMTGHGPKRRLDCHLPKPEQPAAPPPSAPSPHHTFPEPPLPPLAPPSPPPSPPAPPSPPPSPPLLPSFDEASEREAWSRSRARRVELRKLYDLKHGTWHYLTAVGCSMMVLTALEGLSGRASPPPLREEWSLTALNLALALVFALMSSLELPSARWLLAWALLSFVATAAAAAILLRLVAALREQQRRRAAWCAASAMVAVAWDQPPTPLSTRRAAGPEPPAAGAAAATQSPARASSPMAMHRRSRSDTTAFKKPPRRDGSSELLFAHPSS